MTLPRITRIHPVTGRLARPWRGRDHRFQLAENDNPASNPAPQRVKLVDHYRDAVELVLAGHAIRMYDGQARPTFVPARQVRMSHEPYASAEELWAYTTPDPPCTLAQVASEAEAALDEFAALASALAGDLVRLPFGCRPQALTDRNPAARAAARTNLMALINAAYDSAFRQGADLPLDGAALERLYTILSFWRGLGRASARAPGREYGALRQTLRCAVLRASLVHNNLSGAAAVLDVPLAEALGNLGGLGYAAARNSLASAGLHASPDECPRALLEWLGRRRSFAPLRECERVAARLLPPPARSVAIASNVLDKGVEYAAANFPERTD